MNRDKTNRCRLMVRIQATLDIVSCLVGNTIGRDQFIYFFGCRRALLRYIRRCAATKISALVAASEYESCGCHSNAIMQIQNL